MDRSLFRSNVVNRVRGSIIAARLAFVEQQWGKDGWQSLIDKLPINERSRLNSVIFEYNWFNYTTLELIDQLIVRELAAGDRTILRQLGRFSAHYNYSRLPMQLLELSPQEILKRAVRLNVLYQDFGSCRYETIVDTDQIKAVVLVYHYPKEVSCDYCQSALGYFEALLELIGCIAVEVKEKHSSEYNSTTHRYEISWKAVSGPTALPVTRSNARQSSMTLIVRPTNKRPVVTNTVKIDKRAFSRRTHILALLIFVFLLLGVVQVFLHSIYAADEPVVMEKIYRYNCIGTLPAELRIDRPNLLLKTGQDWTNVKIVANLAGTTYHYRVQQLIGEATIEIGLGEFLDVSNRSFNTQQPPSNYSISAQVDQQRQSCDCLLEE
ncbi:MAG: hypothetical protein AB1489_00175 [Acidobacteriota bacterium]